jgi:hypothetical protein
MIEQRIGAFTRETLNEIAWRDFVLFAWEHEDAHTAFRGATGRPQPTKARTSGTPIDTLIDKAMGGQEDDTYMTEFVDWVTRNHWGENYAPEKWKNLRIKRASTAPPPPPRPRS